MRSERVIMATAVRTTTALVPMIQDAVAKAAHDDIALRDRRLARAIVYAEQLLVQLNLTKLQLAKIEQKVPFS